MNDLQIILEWAGQHPFLFCFTVWIMGNIAIAPLKILAALLGLTEVEDDDDE